MAGTRALVEPTPQAWTGKGCPTFPEDRRGRPHRSHTVGQKIPPTKSRSTGALLRPYDLISAELPDILCFPLHGKGQSPWPPVSVTQLHERDWPLQGLHFSLPQVIIKEASGLQIPGPAAPAWACEHLGPVGTVTLCAAACRTAPEAVINSHEWPWASVRTQQTTAPVMTNMLPKCPLELTQITGELSATGQTGVFSTSVYEILFKNVCDTI